MIKNALTETELTLAACRNLCEDATSEAGENMGKITKSDQRGATTFQITCVNTKKHMVQVNASLFGSETRAQEAADILLQLYHEGVSPDDLKRIKANGGLFGVKANKGWTGNRFPKAA